MNQNYSNEHGNYLVHYGILGMKWGQRRWQNPDGSLTSAGYAHYGVKRGTKSNDAKLQRKQQKAEKREANAQRKQEQKEAARRKKLDEILTSGNASEVLRNQKKFTSDELRQAIDRIDKINNLTKKENEQKEADRANSVPNKLLNTATSAISTAEKIKSAKDRVQKLFGTDKESDTKFRNLTVEQLIALSPHASDKELKQIAERVKNYNTIASNATKMNKNASEAALLKALFK